VIPPALEWLLPEPLPEPPALAGFGRPVATLLARRGFRSDDDIRRLLDPHDADLHDVSLMADAGVALSRLERAIEGGERIAIWGDYDADGMTAVAIWVLALRAAGADPMRYIPSRLADGYGLSTAGLDALADRGARLVVTCDCGIVNAAEVEHARTRGIDVIITDHHLPSGPLPNAVAVVDPHRPDCAYPDPDLTGAGISYKLARALLERRGLAATDLAGIAAIGTIADLAPMTGESRAIVQLGLLELATTSSPGLRALLSRSSEHPDQPTARDLAFGVAPRINAAGRIADADLPIQLLLAEDAAAAEALAEQLEAVQQERRGLTTTAIAEAREMLDDGDGPLALRHDAWAPGLLGLIAARLLDLTARPVATVSLVGSELRGSIRAPVDFHAAAALEACAVHLSKRGGHAGAGGFSLAPAAWEAFAAAFRTLPRPYPADAAGTPERPGRIQVDLVLPAAYVDWGLSDELVRLAPFGPGHVEPVVAVTGLVVGEARRVGSAADHLALKMRRGAETLDAIAFGVPPERPVPEPGTALDLVGTLERDQFGGLPRLRIRVLDYADAAGSPLAARRSAARRTTIPVDAPVVAS
jgi:single-stranded-DNA-specific exonuclease